MSFISRLVGAVVILGFATYGLVKAIGNVLTWKDTHDRTPSTRTVVG